MIGSEFPVILGMNPPTKEVLLIDTNKPMKGYACIIFHAKYPKGVQRGDEFDVTYDEIMREGCAAWLQFTDIGALRLFANELLNFANKAEKEEANGKTG